MSKKYSSIFSFILAMVMIFSFSGCDKGEDNINSKDTESKVTSSEENKPKVVKGITINNLDAKYQALIDGMKENGNNNYDYQIENVDFMELDSKINLSHVSGNDYDMLLVNNSSIPQFHTAGVLEPLDSYIEDENIELKYYNDSALKTAVYDDNYYAIPYSPDCRTFAYNKKVLADAGVQPPKSFDDLLPIAKAVTKDGVYAYARVLDPLQPAYTEGCFMLSMGAHIYEKNGDEFKATSNTEKMIGFVKWMQDFNSYIAKDVNLSQDQVRELFVQNRIAFYFFGPWEYDLIIGQNLKVGEDYDLITVPGKDRSGSAIGGFYFGVGSGGKNKDGAWKLISEILKPENQGKVSLSLPSDSRAYDYPPFNTPEYEVFNKQMETAEIPMPPTAQFNKINEVYSEYFNRALLDNMDATEAMNKANEDIQKLLDEE